MNRINALTEDTDSSSSDEDETLVTQEAQETIALSEYMRALKLKNDGQVKVAESLFVELLETQVLNEAKRDAKDNKLFQVKYSCLKNLGLICADRGEHKEAIEYLLKATELDDKDVSLMNRLGKLALTMDQVDIAQMAFQACLRQNPNHWPAADGMLRVLCLREDFAEAYGWALKWYERNPRYQYGLDVILEIREKFEVYGGLEYIERLWKIKFGDTHLKRTNMETVFPKYIMAEPVAPEKPDFSVYRPDEANLSWLSVGELLVRMYKEFAGTSAIGYDLTLDEWLGRNVQATEEAVDAEADMELGTDAGVVAKQIESGSEGGSKENSSSNTDPMAAALFAVPPGVAGAENQTSEEVSGTEESDGGAVAKPKVSRRRAGGDLIGLEQWGWHRNKRYSQRKKSIDKADPDTTVNGMLRKALGKFFEEHFDASISPFASTQPDGAASDASCNPAKAPSSTKATLDGFLLATQDGFAEFMAELKERPYFDVMVLIRLWCQYIGRYWDQPMPEELHNIFKTLYMYHLDHWDIGMWHQLERNDFRSVFRMTLLYLELFHDRAMRLAREGHANELDPTWRLLFSNFIFSSGFYEPDAETEAEFAGYRLRWNWLKYLQARFENDLDLAVDFLYEIEHSITTDTNLHLPNLTHNNFITLPIIADLKVRLERSIRLSTISRLYSSETFSEMVPILVESLQNLNWSADPFILADDSSVNLAPTVQFEMLLECFWQLELPDECLVWCEACLAYSLLHFFKAPPETQRQTKWGESVTFVLTYLVGLFDADSAAIVERMGRFGSRLVQNIVRIVVNQLDSPYDKNNNPAHSVDLKLPWVLLHQLIQRDEDLQYARRRRNAYADANASVVDSQEDVPIPISTMMFFTVHDFLGIRSWCTQNNGEMLLYTMDMVADQLRTPALDRHRDVIAEYLEQVTYCLYGYPAKRARARHIEEHDACNVDLTWPRALQLFDLYRPDTLPEFNSYKNDSISADMEQLLQRIIALLPPEINLIPFTEPILSYITGTSAELSKISPAESLALLPQRIQCIHYLLADHYFKNRDLVKSVKYYVLDLATCPDRFDAWAGLALSKASVLETKLNACTAIATNEFLSQGEESLRCFQQCFRLDDRQVPLWIEYGNFAYIMHSFCSRSLKQASETLSMERFEFLETNKEQCLKIAADCFHTVNAHTATPSAPTSSAGPGTTPTADQQSASQASAAAAKPTAVPPLTNGTHHHPSDDSHDEQWLYHYMLGKVAEKRKDPPDAVIAHYVESAKCLYEHNASYPFKISHSNPQHLSIEALEVYYRITATIVKYLEQHASVPRAVGRLFIRVLREVGVSPFALNQAKIDDFSINALKRKISMAADVSEAKRAKEDSVANEPPSTSDEPDPTNSVGSPDVQIIGDDEDTPETSPTRPMEEVPPTKPAEVLLPAGATADENQSPSRRGSQESNMTTTTNGTATSATTTTGTSDTSSSSSSDSSSSESVSSDDSDDDSTDEDAKSADTPLSENELEAIYKTCIKNLEECVTRFPEHYKSIYRLVNIYLHAPEKIRDLKRCKQLLLGTYTTGLGNQVQGLFVDRKLNNFFNGVWRIPSSEIDRPGSFAAHLSKCTIVLMEVLRLSADHKVLLELALQLQRNPDSDKRYIKDVERRELFQQAISFCTQSFRQLMKEHGVDRRNDGELILLLLDTYKAHKKYLKYTALKECPFAVLLSDAYRVYLEGKLGSARLPEQFNATEYAIRFCQHEIGLRKNLAKNGGALPAPAQPESFLPAHVLRSIMNTPAATTTAPSAVPTTTVTPVVSAPEVVVTVVSTATAPPPVSANPVANIVTVTPVPRVTPSLTITPLTTSTTFPSPAPAHTNTASAPITFPHSTPSTPRPRGRPPGSKNSTPSPAAAAASAAAMASANLMSSSPFGKMDPSTVAAIMGIYNPTSLLPASMSKGYTDPAVALLTEYYKISGMSSLMAGSNPTALLPNTNTGLYPMPPSTSTTASPKLPMYDMNSLISSAAEKMNPPNPLSSSAVISLGSGQLTITPSTVQQSSPRSGSAKQSHQHRYTGHMDQLPSAAASSSSTSSQIFNDMPGISMTKVNPKPNANLLKDLPKSLSITPTSPTGLGSTPSLPSYGSMQYPHVTMQPETMLYPKAKPSKPLGRPKKNAANPSNPYSAAASNLLYNAYPSASTSLHSSSVVPSPAAEYTQQMAVVSQYADIFKNLDPASAAKMLSQFDQYNKFSKPPAKPPAKPRARKPAGKRMSVKQMQAMHQQQQALQQQQQALQQQLHSMQQSSSMGMPSMMMQPQSHPKPPPSRRQSIAGKSASLAANPYTMMPDLMAARAMGSPYGLMGSPGGGGGTGASGVPLHAHSPLKSPMLPPPSATPPQISPRHGHISPSKTLQQVLAEQRQKANGDAEIQQQMQQHQRSESAGGKSSSSSSSRKPDVIILD